MAETKSTTVWPEDIGVLVRWPDLLDVFPSPARNAAASFNALSRLVLFGGAALYLARRDTTFVYGTALLLFFLFGEKEKYRESYYMTKWDTKLEDDVAPKPNPKKDALKQEAQAAARRMVENPRDIRGRAAIVPTTDDVIFATRPTIGKGNWTETQFPDFMSGNVGSMKPMVRPV